MNIPVIYYHSVAPTQHKNWPKKYLTLELKYFEEHLKYLKRNKFETLFFDEYFNKKGKKESSSKNYVCITFDDGFLDNWIYAFPLLKKYGFKATIFVNPEFVDQRNEVRKNLGSYWNGEVTLKEIEKWGYLSWEEMRLMIESGYIDIQSHTLTHTKYFASTKLKGIHRPGADCIYYIGNQCTEEKPYYIENKSFEKSIPYGFPVFEEKSSLITRKVEINEDFTNEVIDLYHGFEWEMDESDISKKLQLTYQNYLNNNNLVTAIESEAAYEERVTNEITSSKSIIEEQLGINVDYICWPHGDYNDFAMKVALQSGFKGATVVLYPGQPIPSNGIDRIGLYHVKNNMFLSRLKTNYKIKSYQGKFPYHQIREMYYLLKY